MTWFTALLAAVSLGLGLLHLVRLATARRDGRPAVGEASHAAMGFGMAAMFSPLGDPLPAAAWIAVFGLSAAWFAASVLRTGLETDDAGHHVVCGIAMLFMLGIGLQTEASGAGGHAHHGGATGPGAWASVVAIGLAGYFAWHVMRCGDRFAAAHRSRTAVLATAGGPAEQEPHSAHPAHSVHSAGCAAHAPAIEGTRLAVLRTPQAAAVAHLVMASAMAVMLLTMI
ncbi:DUF5134 domain-containing protein [Pseudonocardia oroxyli]|uniref:DUF5134 domain-containing protein n=1 Tax=Pseudonocardia oroxyli TaxID=366584 RepID=A0A1G7NFT7_PSEOR|nr:DUF5134 domain-containing protein [Pseudonocardia oroxyli]SDF72955.1 protein of unknown function [Pseudonocardia oroxyli]